MRYHNITKDDMLNGDGLRTVLWLAGCGHGCEGCHNPVTWDPNGGLVFDEKAQEELFALLARPYIDGVTYSGGDPLYPATRKELTKLAGMIRTRFPKKTQWLYTGYLWEEVSKLPVMEYIDVVVDGSYVQEARDEQLRWRGSANQRVIDVPASRASGGIVLYCE